MNEWQLLAKQEEDFKKKTIQRIKEENPWVQNIKHLTFAELKSLPQIWNENYPHNWMDHNIRSNINVSRYRMESGKKIFIRYEIENMLKDGNDPWSKELILARAQLCLKHNVYTVEEWEKYLIPAINKQIED